jgi:choline dehydrogenase
MNVVAGRRQTAADAYLDRAARDRSNLTIVVGATVHRLVMADTTCRGVEYDLAGRLFTATAAAEVVLTAGAIGSPELLLRSGIGPAGHLAAVGVDITADLPGVGSNLQDHPKSQVAYSSPGPVRSGVYARKPHVLMSSTTPSLPDLQLIFIELPVHPRWLPGPEDGFSVIYSLMLPASSGTVRLAGPGPHTPPLIDPGYLTDPGDIERMLSGLSAARDIAAAPALAPFRDKALHPAAADDTNLRGYLRETVTSYFHPVGSCALGTGPDTVVDPQLRVHGVDRLRVADASVFPSLVSGNTNATVLAVAERAADLVIGAASE